MIISGTSFTVTAGTSQTQTVNMAGVSTFTFNSSPRNVFDVYRNAGASNSVVTLTLAGTNTITASNVGVGDVGGVDTTDLATVHLGSVNTINANTLYVGGGYQQGKAAGVWISAPAWAPDR